MPEMLWVKKILFSLIVFTSLVVQAQESQSFYGRMNYGLVPHNILQGVGYAFGYQWNADKSLSYKIETGMVTAFRDRPVGFTFDDIRYKDLYYNLAQLNLSIIPTWRFLSAGNLDLSVGLGFSGVYQSKIFTTVHYEYRNSPVSEYWTSVMQVDAAEGLHAGLTGEFEIKYKLKKHWVIGITAQYQVLLQGEPVILSGIGVGYRF